jgi:hypothetical protein
MTKMILVLGAVLILFLPAARADGGGGDTFFQWTYSMVFIGDSVCGPSGTGVGTSPCVETFNGSFETEEFQLPLGVEFVDGTGSVTTTGPLSGFDCCDAPSFGADGVLQMPSGNGEFDFGALAPGGSEPPPGIYGVFGGFFSCAAGTCANDFNNGVPVQIMSELDVIPGTITIREMPEPPMLAMMFLGILPLTFVRRRRA